MRILLILLILTALPAFAESPPSQCDTCDYWQEDKFSNYRVAETEIRGKVGERVSHVEGQVGTIIWLLGGILFVMVLPWIVKFFSSRKIIFLALLMSGGLLFPVSIPKGECMGGDCGKPCGGDRDCVEVCLSCNRFYFYCE